MDTLDSLKQKHLGQYIENIRELCLKEFDWNEEKTKKALDNAVAAGFVYTAPCNNKISYRKKCQGIIIQDNVKEVEMQTETTGKKEGEKFLADLHAELQTDFVDFKRFLHSEMLSLKAETYSRPSTKGESPARNQHEAEWEKALIRSLENRIISLEKQLSDKQRIIESLLNGPNRVINSSCCENRCVAKGASEEIKRKEKYQETMETKKIHINELNGEVMKHQKEHSVTSTENSTNNNAKREAENDLVKLSLEKSKTRKKTQESDKKNVRKNVFIIGDSILNGLNENGLKKRHNVKVRAHSGATSTDISDHIKPIIRRKPDCVIIHCGTNDITSKEGMDTIKNLKQILSESKRESTQTNIVISSVTTRSDRVGINKEVTNLNKSIKKLAEENGIQLIDNNNIDLSCLSSRKLHLNRKGDSMLAQNFLKFLDKY